MLKWAVLFLIISILAGGAGFTGISKAADRLSKVLFVAFGLLFLFVVLLVLAEMIF